MIQILYYILLLTLLIHKTEQAGNDCIKNNGKNGEECQGKSVIVSMIEWNFIYEEDQSYVCCYYKGKIGSQDYEGCFPFFADYIMENKVNNLLDDMEKGKWELALDVPYNNPSVDCHSEIISFNLIFINIFLFLIFCIFI